MSTQPIYFREVEVTYKGQRRNGEQLQGPEGVVRFLANQIGSKSREHFVAIYLDTRHRPIGYQIVSIGTVSASLVHPREVFQPAIAIGASAVIVAHNHPSGNPSPSKEDGDITARLHAAGEILGITLLDSLVVTDEDHHWVSIK
jgi:DNA repair protein RadC